MYGGRQWRCPTCSADITIPRADEIPVQAVDDGPREPPPAPRRRYEEAPEPRGRPRPRGDQPYDEPYEPEERRGRELSPGWGTARAGLTVINTGLTIFLVAFLAFLGTAVLSLLMARGGGGMGGRNPMEAIGPAVTIVLGLSEIALVILWFVGVGMSCATPGESGGKGLAVGSLICSVLTLLLGLVALLFIIVLASGPHGGGPDRNILPLVMAGFASLIGLVAFILFLFYLRSVASFFGNNGLAANIVTFFIVTLLFLVGMIGVSVLAGLREVDQLFAGRVGAAGAVLMPIVILAVYVLLLGWFIYLVSATRTTIPRPQLWGRRRDYY
jgi:hypothetical protein